MKKYIFSFILIIALSLSALYLFESKEVKAVEYYDYNVIFELTESQKLLGLTFADGTTANKYAYFNEVDGFYQLINGVKVKDNLLPNRGYSSGISAPNLNTHFHAWVGFNYNGLDSMRFISKLNQTAWFTDLFTSNVDTNVPFIFRYEFAEDVFSSYFTYYNPNLTQPDFETLPVKMVRGWSLGEFSTSGEWGGFVLNAPSYDNNIFSGWLIDNTFYTYSESYHYYPSSTFNAVAQYVPDSSTFIVSFYDGLNLIGSQSYSHGIGTIIPPTFNFGVGQSLLGWSLSLGGSILNLSNYNLVEDLSLYAVKEFNSDSTINGGSFEIPYKDCDTFDIPCHLGNAVVYFLNEFPLISDIATFIYPIGDFLNEFPQYFQVFETLGFFFTFSMGILLMTFIFRLLR